MEFLPLLALPFLLLAGLCWLLAKAGEGIMFLIRYAVERRRARIERELDERQAELRKTILTLAQQLDGSAHEARKTLIRESFLASGQVPRNH